MSRATPAGLDRSEDRIEGSCGCTWQSFASKATKTLPPAVGQWVQACPMCGKRTRIVAVWFEQKGKLF